MIDTTTTIETVLHIIVAIRDETAAQALVIAILAEAGTMTDEVLLVKEVRLTTEEAMVAGNAALRGYKAEAEAQHTQVAEIKDGTTVETHETIEAMAAVEVALTTTLIVDTHRVITPPETMRVCAHGLCLAIAILITDRVTAQPMVVVIMTGLTTVLMTMTTKIKTKTSVAVDEVMLI